MFGMPEVETPLCDSSVYPGNGFHGFIEDTDLPDVNIRRPAC